MSARGLFAACACNPTTGALDWNEARDLIAYGASNFLFLYAPNTSTEQPPQVVATCTGHTKRINCVEWVRQWSPDGRTKACTNTIVTGSSDASVIVWQAGAGAEDTCSIGRGTVTATVVQRLTEPTESIAALATACDSTNTTTIVASSGDHAIRIWKAKAGAAFQLFQTISTPHHYTMAIALALLPTSSALVLARAGDDMMVHLHTAASADSQFTHQDALQGHEDWVQALDFVHEDAALPHERAADGGHALLLASGAQDCMIRIWRIQHKAQVDAADTLPVSSSSSSSEAKDNEILSRLLETSRRSFAAGDEQFSVNLDALLYGHENKVFSIKWSKQVPGVQKQPLHLLSASFDKTMVVWEQDESGVWVDSVRVGNIGGNSLGFFGCQFGPQNAHIIAHAHQGSLHEWSFDESKEQWLPKVTVGGHFKGVTGLSWCEDGAYLLTASADQTTRLFTQWQTFPQQRRDSTVDLGPSWHEVGRPQIHGYDMRCVAAISKDSFVSGADEKVVRTFEAPSSFFDAFEKLTSIKLASNDEPSGVNSTTDTVEASKKNAADGECTESSEAATSASNSPDTKRIAPSSRAVVASVPALGLSNKAVYSDEATHLQEGQDNDREGHASVPSFRSTGDAVYPVALDIFDHPPFEEHLAQNTLWPETRKLYGHGYEILCVAANHEHSLLATACRASKEEHAQIRLWDLTSGLEVAALAGHSLSVVSLAFSHNDDWLVSVSRDRSFCIFHRQHSQEGSLTRPLYAHVATRAKAHDRIIWDLSWAPDDSYFVTVSRDKKARVWTFSLEDGLTEVCSLPKFKEAVTCVDLCALNPGVDGEGATHVMALGFDSGAVRVFHAAATTPSKWTPLLLLPENLSHHSTVKHVAWRPRRNQELQLASCGIDQLVRISTISFREQAVPKDLS